MANVVRQKARSTIRCIKTLLPFLLETPVATGQKARSAIRCIKTQVVNLILLKLIKTSESAERHKVH